MLGASWWRCSMRAFAGFCLDLRSRVSGFANNHVGIPVGVVVALFGPVAYWNVPNLATGIAAGILVGFGIVFAVCFRNLRVQ